MCSAVGDHCQRVVEEECPVLRDVGRVWGAVRGIVTVIAMHLCGTEGDVGRSLREREGVGGRHGERALGALGWGQRTGTAGGGRGMCRAVGQRREAVTGGGIAGRHRRRALRGVCRPRLGLPGIGWGLGGDCGAAVPVAGRGAAGRGCRPGACGTVRGGRRWLHRLRMAGAFGGRSGGVGRGWRCTGQCTVPCGRGRTGYRVNRAEPRAVLDAK